MSKTPLSEQKGSRIKPEDQIEPEVLRVNEFCEKYVLSRSSMYREIHARCLQAIKRG